MDLNKRIEAFDKLGEFLKWFCRNTSINNINGDDKPFLNKYEDWKILLEKQIRKSEKYNPWFTTENTIYALKNISSILEHNKLKKWTDSYDLDDSIKTPLIIAVVLAGNIPLVGFSDFLCVLISGNVFYAKMSSKDNELLPLIKEILVDIEQDFESRIIFCEENLSDFDAVIATGSNNTSRYFEYYFSKYHNIIRNNRNSIAILSGKENKQELEALGEDVLRYFGLGCRNISKIFLPRDYSVQKVLDAMEKFQDISLHNKYVNNYDYNKSIYLMSQITVHDNGFLLMKEDEGLSSPVSVLFYEFYDNMSIVNEKINSQSKDIQCVVAKKGILDNTIEFGESQKPGLFDYADNIDTMRFLTVDILKNKNNT